MTRSQQRESDALPPSSYSSSPPLQESPPSDETGSTQPPVETAPALAPAGAAAPSSQFSLSSALLVIGLFAMLLGPVVWLRVPWFAGFLGVGSLVVLAVISIFNDRQRVVQGGWWLLAALYLSSLVALYIHS